VPGSAKWEKVSGRKEEDVCTNTSKQRGDGLKKQGRL
jgi:hypothetical protein